MVKSKMKSTLFLGILVTVTLALAACGASAESSPSSNSEAPAAVTLTPGPVPQPSLAPMESQVTNNPQDLIARGEEIFQKTAGDVGCAACHGPEAKGELEIGPYIRGKPRETIADALKTVGEMEFLDLSEEEIDAVAAYLKYLKTQP